MATPMTGSHERRETHDLIGSDKVEGTNVYRSNGDKIGAIERIMIDKQSGGRDFEGVDDDLLIEGPIGDAQLALVAAVAKLAKQEAVLTLTRRLSNPAEGSRT